MTEDALPLVDRLRAAIGDELTYRLIRQHGGTTVYVPHDPKPTHTITAGVGVDGARRLSGIYGGEFITVPLARRFMARHLHRIWRFTPRQIARALLISTASARRYLR